MPRVRSEGPNRVVGFVRTQSRRTCRRWAAAIGHCPQAGMFREGRSTAVLERTLNAASTGLLHFGGSIVRLDDGPNICSTVAAGHHPVNGLPGRRSVDAECPRKQVRRSILGRSQRRTSTRAWRPVDLSNLVAAVSCTPRSRSGRPARRAHCRRSPPPARPRGRGPRRGGARRATGGSG